MVQVHFCPPARPVFKKNAYSADSENTDPGKYCVKGGIAKSCVRMSVNACHVQDSEKERNQKADQDDQKSMAPQKDHYGLKHTPVFLEMNSTARAFPATWSGASGRLCFMCFDSIALEESPPIWAGIFNSATSKNRGCCLESSHEAIECRF
jgi:hypothetical protein